ncbi:MAG: TIM barrel protein [Planctomycetaceae bacterium]|nr:TIM barrel protein [Planctomycetaceae bacterium]
MPQAEQFNRRTAAKAAGTALAATFVASLAAGESRSEETAPSAPKGNVKQSLCRWCYGDVPLDKLAAAAKGIGYRSIELVTPEEFPTVQAAGLTCAMLSGADAIDRGFNRPQHHDQLKVALADHIEFAAKHGLPNVICFSGNRRGMSDDEGLEHCTAGLKQIVGLAERKNVTICMELLNSRVDHGDYMCDRTPWGVELVKQVGSPRFKLLYDIYHMQIMEGDVIRTIRDNQQYIGHYHTGGNPGRHEIDDTQELNYPAIMRAIVETGYDGYVGQEFIPSRDPLTSLAEGFRVCDV